MPDIGIFVLGAIVTAVTVIACILVGRAEAEDERVRGKEARLPRESMVAPQ
ncbi:MAG: hypothetical protein MUF27_05530 [Acidobacteria bacterium]|nr:hypothetical protein [Acidobacteriota bacterium]